MDRDEAGVRRRGHEAVEDRVLPLPVVTQHRRFGLWLDKAAAREVWTVVETRRALSLPVVTQRGRFGLWFR